MILGDPSAFGFLVLLGCASGFVSGLLGIGGGTILVPALIAGLPLLGIQGPELPKIAMATSLALVVPTAIASAQMHASKGAIDWSLLGLLCPSIIAGSFVAATFAKGLPTQFLCALFVVFALFTAWGLLQRQDPRAARATQRRPTPGLVRITATGVLGGAFASLLGLGVAFFSVPIMTRFIAVPRAIGTAAALCIPMALAGVAGYLLGGAPDACGGACAGHIYLPAVAAIGITAVLTAPMGARLTHLLPVILMRRLFALFLIAAAAQLAYKFIPLASGIEQTRFALAQLMTPSAAGLPVAAQAPGWLEAGRREAHLALVAQYGPRRAFLPLLRSGEDGAAGLFMLAAPLKTDAWFVKPAGAETPTEPGPSEMKAEESPVKAVAAGSVPEAAGRDLPMPAKRPDGLVRPRAEPARQPRSSAQRAAPPPDLRPRTQARPAPTPQAAGPEGQIPQSALFDPFAFFTAPGPDKAQNWSN